MSGVTFTKEKIDSLPLNAAEPIPCSQLAMPVLSNCVSQEPSSPRQLSGRIQDPQISQQGLKAQELTEEMQWKEKLGDNDLCIEIDPSTDESAATIYIKAKGLATPLENNPLALLLSRLGIFTPAGVPRELPQEKIYQLKIKCKDASALEGLLNTDLDQLKEDLIEKIQIIESYKMTQTYLPVPYGAYEIQEIFSYEDMLQLMNQQKYLYLASYYYKHNTSAVAEKFIRVFEQKAREGKIIDVKKFFDFQIMTLLRMSQENNRTLLPIPLALDPKETFNTQTDSKEFLGSLVLSWLSENHFIDDDQELAEMIILWAAYMNQPEIAQECFTRCPFIGKSILAIGALVPAAAKLHLSTAKVILDITNQAPKNLLGPYITALVNLPTRLNESEKLETLAFTDRLLTMIDSNVHYATHLSGETALSVVERALLFQGTNEEVLQEIAEKMLQKGAFITPKMADMMKKQTQHIKEKRWIPYLEKQGLLTPEEKELLLYQPSDSTVDSGTLAQQANLANQYLRDALRIHHLNPELIPLEKIIEIKTLKDSIKAFLPKSEGPFQESLLQQYSSLKENVGALAARHLLLRELKSIHREWKLLLQSTAKEPSKRILRFFSLFHPSKTYNRPRIKEQLPLWNTALQKHYWSQTIESVFRAAMKEFLILWFHGGKTSSLPMILKMNALVPLGELIRNGIPSFSGAITGSDEGINQNALSGERFSATWEADEGYLFDASTRFLVSLMYAMKDTGVHSTETSFDPAKAWERLSESFLKKILNDQSSSNSWAILRVDILRIRMTDPDADQKLLSFKAHVEEQLQLTPLFAFILREDLESLLKALTVPIKFQLSNEDLQIIKNPFPIVYASQTVVSTPLPNQSQFLAIGRQELGKDIQVVFTEANRVEEVQQWMGTKVKVYHFENAFYLEMMNMARGSYYNSIKHLPISVQISKTLQRDILPLYATPFPAVQDYLDDSGNVVTPAPVYGQGISSYEEYIKQVQNGQILPRSIHGTMHPSRATMWTQLLAKFFPAVNLYLLALSMGCHDKGRKTDWGKDFWDEASANFFRGYCLSRGFSLEEILPYFEALNDKDPKNNVYTSDAQRIIHDADVFEIRRVLTSDSQFIKEKLCFTTLRGVDASVKEALTKEIFYFIQVTENPKLKMYMEQHSDDFLGDLYRLMAYLHAEKECFPLLKHYLKEEIKAFSDIPLTQELAELATA